ncbi:MAG: hypothetical protein KKF48_04945 [Nanoarchaeota archaeon]|nr:hypothetical protein [Nanoarchaeota archaeon]MBU1028364.1 hypothetical protein [Nanoarchaeota archaeon]
MITKRTLIRKVVPIVATSLFGIGALIGLQGDNLKYKEVSERFPQARRDYISGQVSNLKELSNVAIEEIRELEDKASERYGVSAPFIILGSLSLLGASAYSLRNKQT